MQAIWQWRLLRTVESQAAIPEPFRPTPLQCISTDHPVIIDLLTWPSIRDQLIRNQAAVDLDALTRDLTLHTVVEVPEEGVAVSVYDHMLATLPLDPEQLFQEKPMHSCFDDPEWTYIRAPLQPDLNLSMDPVDAVIIGNLADQMQNLSLQRSVHALKPSSLPGACSYSFSSLPLLDTRVNQLHKWKLSREFPKKWPILDCSQVISAYDTVPYTATMVPYTAAT
ncbi:hypothetical protein BDV18DRAFT_121867 [Aspergillus unguis]